MTFLDLCSCFLSAWSRTIHEMARTTNPIWCGFVDRPSTLARESFKLGPRSTPLPDIQRRKLYNSDIRFPLKSSMISEWSCRYVRQIS